MKLPFVSCSGDLVILADNNIVSFKEITEKQILHKALEFLFFPTLNANITLHLHLICHPRFQEDLLPPPHHPPLHRDQGHHHRHHRRRPRHRRHPDHLLHHLNQQARQPIKIVEHFIDRPAL